MLVIVMKIEFEELYSKECKQVSVRVVYLYPHHQLQITEALNKLSQGSLMTGTQDKPARALDYKIVNISNLT